MDIQAQNSKLLIFYFLHSSFNEGNAVPQQKKLSFECKLYHHARVCIIPSSLKKLTCTRKHPVKSNIWDLLPYCFSLAYFCSPPSIIINNLYLYCFSISTPKGSCCSHIPPFPVITFSCAMQQLVRTGILNKSHFFSLTATFRSLNFSEGRQAKFYFTLGHFIIIDKTFFSFSQSSAHVS